ncbi:MAG: porin [Eudoraea sp.]|uniref:porin n=1 Tax=Eudoraea sp. TaxID=1979955 RepID=UPI003263F584
MNIFKKLNTIIILLLTSINLSAQVESVWHQKPEIKFSGFIDVFYIYDFNQPQGTSRQPFLFNHNRHNEFNLNLGLVKFALEHTKYRANLAFQAGTYANDNYAAEPGLLKIISEANIGILLSKKINLWLDAGVLPSHLGLESPISMDNYTFTRSLLVESSPYFLTGVKLTFNPTDKWEIAGLIVNGWQRIQRLQGNSLLSFGTQVIYSPTEKIKLNWSTFIGTDDPDTTRRMRYFNNLYGQFQLAERIGLIAGFDIGIQQRTKGSSDYDIWLSPIVIGQYTFNKTWKTAIRAEYYQDETGIIIPTGTINGFQTTGLSLNLDYSPTSYIVCRLEGRWLNSKDDIFETKTTPTNNNFIIGASIAIKLVELLQL